MIDALQIEGTEDTPHIIFDKVQNKFQFSGSSMPENSSKFFAPVTGWINEYVKDPNPETIITCQIQYLNSSSSRKLFEIFLRFQEVLKSGNKIKIVWEYLKDDLLIQEKGLELKEILEIPFDIRESN